MNGHERQKEQSRQMIEEALLELIGEKDFAKIKVSEIAERADVARRTFYRMYRGKEDVLGGYFERLCRKYREGHGQLFFYDIRRIAGEFFSFWYQYKDMLLLFHQRGLDEMLYAAVNRSSFEVVQGRISGKETDKTKEAEAMEYFACYSTGGLVNLLRYWVGEGMAEGPEEYGEKTGKGIERFCIIRGLH